MVIHGIAKFAKNARIGVNGIARFVINVHMGYHCHAKIAIMKDLFRVWIKYARCELKTSGAVKKVNNG